MAAKASDRRQRSTANTSRANPITAGKWHSKSGSARSWLTCCNGRGPVTCPLPLPYGAPRVPGRRNRSPWSSQIGTCNPVQYRHGPRGQRIDFGLVGAVRRHGRNEGRRGHDGRLDNPVALAGRCPGGVLVARVLSSRHSTGPRQNPATESPGRQEAGDALRLRYANGEISREDYLQGTVKLEGDSH